MNIFAVHRSPIQAARQLCDKHVWKMHTESIQLLVSLANNLDIKHHVIKADGTLHQGGYPHHPCCKWLEESIHNVEWLVTHTAELCLEHQRRQLVNGRDFIPFSLRQLNDWVGIAKPWVERALPRVPQTPFCQCMPEQYRCDDAIQAYRNYYIGDKVGIAEWNYCDPPQWWVEAFDYAGEEL